ncbi:TetR/AcrR family transcriptional regulator [Alkalibacter mobilis]|uniref:TetR/AcrR family transcriptional regulator n=1 Tax=Alkalibacter mobilis TaxID=2787712 RepID=UPI00189FF6A4|nr:TetR/AcrR family transcriptional regulator [Alkalibacter mobilis]MBF7096581.1 TetR/AcrR family transcriptional regulator [Alkalibacter mobilis]
MISKTKNREYSEKEKAILESTVKILSQGTNPYSVKVSEIAELAGVGKGTVYEYFKSKEEVLYNSIVFCIHTEMNSVKRKLIEAETFVDRLEIAMSSVSENLKNKFSAFNLMSNGNWFKEFFPKNIHHEDNCFTELKAVEEIIDLIVEAGEREKYMLKTDSVFYKRMVIKNALFSYGHYLLFERNFDIMIKNGDIKSDIYKMVVRSLKESEDR